MNWNDGSENYNKIHALQEHVRELQLELRRAARVLDDAAEFAGRNDVPMRADDYAQAAMAARRVAAERE